MAMQLLGQGKTLMALMLLVAFEMYLRPGEAVELCKRHVVAPVRMAGKQYSTIHVVIRDQAGLRPDKTGTFDNSLPFDKAKTEWIGDVLLRKAKDLKKKGDRIFNFSLDDFRKSFAKASMSTVSSGRLLRSPVLGAFALQSERSIAGVDHFDFGAAEANKVFSASIPPVSSRLQWQHILHGTNGRADSLHLSTSSLLPWPYKLLTGGQNYSFWPGPLWPNCSSTLPQFPFVDIFAEKVFFFEGESDLKNAVYHDCGAGCLYNVETDPGEHRDLSSNPEYAGLLASLQHELSDLNVKTPSEPGYGNEPAVKVCLQALKTSTYGPFVDADLFYTEWPNGEQRPSPERAAKDFKEIMTLHKMLSNKTSRAMMTRELYSQMTVDSGTTCSEK
ncbi:unnamed protein product [Durusdinium trenchii]|uniref:Uncharacterized protein n=1 Tax=Durusdinium trenchii TaxID=1381693 RepID=A0ABP0HGT0_9DINO